MRPFFLLSVAATTLVACADGPTAAARLGAAPRTTRAGAAVERPWKGHCDATVTFTSATTLVFTGPCELAHLGRATVIAYQTIMPGPTGIAFTNAATYTAANGDVLYTTDTGLATPTADGLGLTLEATETAVGGTGRFQGASGIAILRGSVRSGNAFLDTGEYTVEGRLSY